MKKAIALVMVLAVTATTLFAGPVSALGSVNIPSTEITLAGMPSQTNDFDDLFAGIQVATLTPAEAQAVEGDGWFSALVAAVATVVVVKICNSTGNTGLAAAAQSVGTDLAIKLFFNPAFP
jgi:hypothetical protein